MSCKRSLMLMHIRSKNETMSCLRYCSEIPYSRKFWWELNLADCLQRVVFGGFKFGEMRVTMHVYGGVVRKRDSVDLYLAEQSKIRQSAKLSPRQLFQLHVFGSMIV